MDALSIRQSVDVLGKTDGLGGTYESAGEAPISDPPTRTGAPEGEDAATGKSS